MEKNRELRFPTAIAFRDAHRRDAERHHRPMTPLPPSVRAAMPTARDIAGPLTAGRARRPCRRSRAPQMFGTTADMTGRSSGRQRVRRHRRRHNRAERVRLRRRGDGEAAPGAAGCRTPPCPPPPDRPRAAASGRPGRDRATPDARRPAAGGAPRRRTSGRAARGGRRAPEPPATRRAVAATAMPASAVPRRPSPPPRRHHPRRLRRRQRRHAARARCWPKAKNSSHRAK